MRTTMNFTLKEKLKKEFYDLAKNMGTTPSNLLNMLMQNAVITRSINITLPSKNDWGVEIEPLDTSDWGEEFNRKTEENTKKLKNLITNGKV
ncbi:hypothetical protein CSA08_04530 [Candidatus Gracilibacteria bacterium]|nr:MAG: hypothetical protein CSA08_04530 [Candidatus Gracilibacteria bacterium]